MKALIIADTDLDGTSSAVIIACYLDLFKSRIPFRKDPRITYMFPSRPELDELFGSEKKCQKMVDEFDRIFICDTAPNSEKACKNIGTILAPKVTYFDHHSTNRDRLLSWENNFDQFCIIEGPRCSAKLAYDTLWDDLFYKHPPNKYRNFQRLANLALLVNDIDMWYREIPRSMELADFVGEVGPKAAFLELLSIATCPYVNTYVMTDALNRVAVKKKRSMSLGKGTLIKHKGYRVPFYTCLVNSYASEVGSALVANTGLIAMLDISDGSFNFRIGPRFAGSAWHRAKGKKPNSLDFAEALGGGGHPQAAGASAIDNPKILKALSQTLGQALLENYNERTRGRRPANRRVRRKNVRRR